LPPRFGSTMPAGASLFIANANSKYDFQAAVNFTIDVGAAVKVFDNGRWALVVPDPEDATPRPQLIIDDSIPFSRNTSK
jgi:hypothetical protein